MSSEPAAIDAPEPAPADLPAVVFRLRVCAGAAQAEFVAGDCVGLLGVAAEQLRKDWLADRVHPDDAALALPEHATLAAYAQVEHLFRLRHPAGDYRWLRLNARLHAAGTPDDYRLAGTLTDGDEHHRLRRSAQRYREFSKLTSDWYWEQDEQFRFTYFSKEFEAITGISLTGILGRTRWEGLASADYADVDWADHQARLHAHQPFRDFEYPSRKNGDHSIWFRVSGYPVFDEQGRFRGYAGIGSEIGAYKRIQEELKRVNAEQKTLIDRLHQARQQMLQSEKMASIGQLAAGVAHEINNPVGFVKSNFATLRTYFGDLLQLLAAAEALEAAAGDAAALAAFRGEKARLDLAYVRSDAPALFAECAEGIERVRRIVRALLDFSQEGGGVPNAVDLHAVLEGALNVAAAEIAPRADVIRRYAELPAVTGHAGPLGQVFLNLLINAAQAIDAPPRGTITVATRHDGNGVEVEIADSGGGIAPEVLGKIFDPFFTTRPVGRGAGLGLSVAYGIVEKHGGRIEVSSTPGQGSRFVVRLPEWPTH